MSKHWVYDLDLPTTSGSTPIQIDWEGRPAIYTPERAWAILASNGGWTEVNSFEVADSGHLISPKAFEARYPDVPLPPIHVLGFKSWDERVRALVARDLRRATPEQLERAVADVRWTMKQEKLLRAQRKGNSDVANQRAGAKPTDRVH